MAMTRADVYDEGIWRRCHARQRPAQPLIHRLSNKMFDHRAVRKRAGSDHIERSFGQYWKLVNKNVAIFFIICHFLSECSPKCVNCESKNTCKRWNLPRWKTWRSRLRRRLPRSGAAWRFWERVET